MTKIKIGDTIRVKEIGVKHPAPAYYKKFVGKEVKIIGEPSSQGVSAWLDGGVVFFYFDEIELVEPKSMFEFGPYNQNLKDKFLAYLDEKRAVTGLCAGVSEGFMDKKIDELGLPTSGFPIEYAILAKNHKKRDKDSLFHAYSNQRKYGRSMTSTDTPYGRLRRWWAYNLAVAVSQKPEL